MAPHAQKLAALSRKIPKKFVVILGQPLWDNARLERPARVFTRETITHAAHPAPPRCSRS